MAKFHMLNMRDWVFKEKQKQQLLVKNVARRLGDIAQRPVKEGGRMPVLTGALRASYHGSLNGQVVARGPEAHVTVSGRIQLGDIASFEWGSEAVPYALAQNYGYSGTDSRGRSISYPGKHWLEHTVAQAQRVTAEEIAKIRAMG